VTTVLGGDDFDSTLLDGWMILKRKLDLSSDIQTYNV
jgi:hypothetical protein